MGFFEGKIELYQVLFFIILPVGIPALLYLIKAKLLWISPIATFVMGLLLTLAFYPYYYTDIINNSSDSTTIYWLYFSIPVQFITSLFATIICYFIKHIGKRTK